ncbi:hypothetical protein [Kordiimonas marina]|uniref:hypothetical protein n=1 Tax=Kordiimonas marina TaxID=2872312 RepID=UPI001FF1F24B|nr:hypothetical protein [Kordiimonas marina]MCJ9428378.1 hypothetical protein [Kordiimonas marina]
MINNIDDSQRLQGELDQAIEKALDNRQMSLLGALYRIQGSTHGWCSDDNCGLCPLAERRCTDELEGRLKEIVEAHHREKAAEAKPKRTARRAQPYPYLPR